MFRISKDSPAYYITSVARNRLPVFRTTAVKNIACLALDEARQSAGFLLLAYVLMTDQRRCGSAEGQLRPSKSRSRRLGGRAEDYLWSSVRCWARTTREADPLMMDVDKVAWRARQAQPHANMKGGADRKAGGFPQGMRRSR